MLDRLPAPLPILIESLRHPEQFPAWRWRSVFLLKYCRFLAESTLLPPVEIPGPQRLTVALLSFRRVWNMQPLVRGLLRARFVEKVIVSNNNPEHRIRDWVRLEDPRLVLIDQPQRTPPGIRFELCRAAPGQYFATIDDDTFVSPGQLRELFLRLISHPQAPHGLRGEDYLPGAPTEAKGPWGDEVRNRETQVDVLNGVYAFTRAHCDALFRLAGELGLRVPEVRNGEDVLLSHAGSERPFVHDLGPLTECLSAHQGDVSIFRTHPNFYREREALLLRLRALQRGAG